MEDKIYKSIYDMAEDMCDLAADDCYVVAALFYEDAADLLKALISIDCENEIDIASITLEKPEYNLYNKEYYVSLTLECDKIFVTVEPAYIDGVYLLSDCDVLLIDGDASSRIILRHENSECYQVAIVEDEMDDYGFTCDHDCENCEYYGEDYDDDGGYMEPSPFAIERVISLFW